MASLAHLAKQVLVQKGCVDFCVCVCVCMPVFVLAFAYAYAVHLITSAGEVTAAALRGVQFPKKYSDLPSSKNGELVCRTECKLAGSSVLVIHPGCREVGKWH